MILLSMVLLTLAMFLVNCGKEDRVATITSTQVVKVFQNSDTIITISANISDDGGSPITERGIVYSLTTNPTVSDSKVTSASGGQEPFQEHYQCLKSIQNIMREHMPLIVPVLHTANR